MNFLSTYFGPLTARLKTLEDLLEALKSLLKYLTHL